MQRETAGPRSPVLRLFSTGLVVGLAWLLGSVLLPGISAAKLADLRSLMAPDIDTSSMSITALGLRPLVSGFFLVEILALLIPAWRPLRADGGAGRRKLTRAALLVSLVIALGQGFLLGRWLESSAADPRLSNLLVADPPPAFAGLAALSLAAGTALLWVLAGLIDRVGLGCGMAILLGLESLWTIDRDVGRNLVSLLQGQTSPASFSAQIVLCLGVALASWVMLRGLAQHSAARKDSAPIQQPVTSLVPLQAAASLVMLVSSAANLGWIPPSLAEPLAPGLGAYYAAQFVLLIGLGILCGWLFTRPQKGIPFDPAQRQRALQIGMLYLIALWCVSIAMSRLHLQTALSPLHIVAITAIALDIAASWRARQLHAELFPIWHPASVDAAIADCEKLHRAGIFALTRGLYPRSLWRFFGPIYALDVMVRPADAERAQRILAGLVSEDEPANPDGVSPIADAKPSKQTVVVLSGVLAALLLICLGPAYYASLLSNRPAWRLVLRSAQPNAASMNGLPSDVEVLRTRLQTMGIASARVALQGSQIVVELPKLATDELDRARKNMLRSGRLEFREADHESPYMMKLAQFVTDNEAQFPEIKPAIDNWQGRFGEPQKDIYLKARSEASLMKLLAALPPDLAPPADREIRFEQSSRIANDDAPNEMLFRTHYLVRASILGQHAIRDAEVVYDPMQRPQIMVTFAPEDATRFADFTASHIGKQLAIVLEDAVMSAPRIQDRITGGKASISLGQFGDAATLQREADDLAAVLRTGALPELLRIDHEAPID